MTSLVVSTTNPSQPPHTVYSHLLADRGPPREDLPLPTEPPFTAFIGNLAFDLTEGELEEFFAPVSVSVLSLVLPCRLSSHVLA